MQTSPIESAAVASTAASERGVALRIEHIVKRYGEREVLKDIGLDIAPGEFVAIVGRSGCGKSTLLRLIAGLEEAQQGRILYNGQTADSHHDTRIMFQDSRLLPWKRVLANVMLALPDSAHALAHTVLSEVGLADRAWEWPAKLSGGQRQRVALARALVHRPRLLLLDEPLGALDALTRIEMHALIEKLWREHGFTALLVTHDVSEAVALADRIVLIDEGRVTLDLKVPLARPRERGSRAFGQLEESVLNEVLRHKPATPNLDAESGDLSLHRTVGQLRWAV